jgi:hypothetical protein
MYHLIAKVFLLVAGISVVTASLAEPFEPPVVHEKVHRTIEIDKSGRYTETVERVTRIVSEYGVDFLGHHVFEAKSTQETLKVLSASNRLPNGKEIHLAKDWIKKSEGEGKNGRQFDDKATTTIVFPQVEVGSRLRSKYIMRHFKPEKPGQFDLKFGLSPHLVYEDSQVTIKAPKSLGLMTNQRGFEGGVISESKQTITYHFRIRQPIAQKKEEGSVEHSDHSPFLVISQAKDYLEIGRQYHQSASKKARITPEIAKLARELTANASNEQEKAKALYHWVSKHIRYISTTVDDGGLVPRDSAYIFNRKFGDCKDHVVMLEVLLRAVGIESTAALINLGEAFQLPAGPAAHSPINHVITYIPSLDLYLDSTAQFVPFGKLDDQVIDKPTILVALNRYGRTPKMVAEDNTMKSHTHMLIRPDGSVEGRNETALTGTMEINYRLSRFSEMTEPMEKTVNDILYRFNEIGSGNISYTSPKNIEAPFTWQSIFKLEPITDLRSKGAFIPPVGVSPGHIAAMTIYKPLDSRAFPFVCDSESTEDKYSIQLPDHIKIESLPNNVTYQSDHIRYTSDYQLHGQSLEITRKLTFQYPSRKCTPDMYPELLDGIRAIRSDHRASVVFTSNQVN